MQVSLWSYSLDRTTTEASSFLRCMFYTYLYCFGERNNYCFEQPGAGFPLILILVQNILMNVSKNTEHNFAGLEALTKWSLRTQLGNHYSKIPSSLNSQKLCMCTHTHTRRFSLSQTLPLTPMHFNLAIITRQKLRFVWWSYNFCYLNKWDQITEVMVSRL